MGLNTVGKFIDDWPDLNIVIFSSSLTINNFSRRLVNKLFQAWSAGEGGGAVCA